MQIKIGCTYLDVITKFKGIAIGHVEYMTGCNQTLLSPEIGADGEFKDSHWFDDQRLEKTGAQQVVLDNGETPGGDIPAPLK
ncbi:MAG: hypothetical protein V3U60_16610 [Gammaproteobacteria bacterium]